MAKLDTTRVEYIFPAAYIAVGGMAFVLVTLWSTQALASSWDDGRLVIDGSLQFWLVPVLFFLVCTSLARIITMKPMGRSIYSTSNSGYTKPYSYSSNTVYEYSPEDSVGSLITMGLCIGVVALAMCMIISGRNSTAFLISLMVSSVVAYFINYFFDSRRQVRLAIVALWAAGYMLTWFFGFSHSLSLPWFIVGWLTFGAGAGMIVTSMMRVANIRAKNSEKEGSRIRTPFAPVPSAAGQKDFNYRRRHTSGVYSEFGRLPRDTVNLMAHLVRSTNGPIASALPIEAGPEMTADTIRIVLDHLLLDWRQNNNLTGLDDADIQDIRSFVTFAATAVRGSYDPVSRTAYRAYLTYLMVDWLNNWNSDGQSGPPV